MTEKPKKERIAKIIARSGLCSRRQAERWILSGRVKLNGQLVETPAITVSAKDKITVDGKQIPDKERTRLFMYHKPAGLITSNRDEQGRATIFDKFPKEMPRVVTIGRLDMNTQGLLLLTNDGELSRYMELPKTAQKRTYRARAYGKISQERLDTLKSGITIDGIKYGSIDAEIEKLQGSNMWLNITITEGKNREIRKVMEYLGLKVNRLIRVSYGNFHLGKLPKGAIMEVKYKTIKQKIPGFFKQ